MGCCGKKLPPPGAYQIYAASANHGVFSRKYLNGTITRQRFNRVDWTAQCYGTYRINSGNLPGGRAPAGGISESGFAVFDRTTGFVTAAVHNTNNPGGNVFPYWVPSQVGTQPSITAVATGGVPNQIFLDTDRMVATDTPITPLISTLHIHEEYYNDANALHLGTIDEVWSDAKGDAEMWAQLDDYLGRCQFSNFVIVGGRNSFYIIDCYGFDFFGNRTPGLYSPLDVNCSTTPGVVFDVGFSAQAGIYVGRGQNGFNIIYAKQRQMYVGGSPYGTCYKNSKTGVYTKRQCASVCLIEPPPAPLPGESVGADYLVIDAFQKELTINGTCP